MPEEAARLHDPDGDLIRRVGEGDASAIERLVKAKLPRMLAFGTRLLGDPGEAEDMAQELFLRVWRQAARWQPGRAKFDTWMHRVALNLCTDRLRRRRERPLPQGWDAPDPAGGAQAGMEEAERGRAVDRALAALAPRQREAIVLVHYQELSSQEAAAAMEIGIDALESLLARGRRALRARLTEEDDG